MKKFRNSKWFFPFAVVLCLCAIALGVQVTYGAYIRRSYVKAVIATNETEKLFGSNLLYGVKNQPDDPDTAADTEKDTKQIALILSSRDASATEMEEGAIATAEDAGYKILSYDAQSDASHQHQVSD